MKKIIVCTILIFVSSMTPSIAGKKKNKQKKVEPTEKVIKEIDNYDFLYTGEDFEYNENVTGIDMLMDEAFSHIGARYCSGAKGSYAFDCSGFTSYVYGQMNISIGCSSRDQYAKNMPIGREDLEAGDLVFFTSPGSGRGVGHVGIVVDVNHENGTFDFIHASTREGVKVNCSTDGYYARRYVGARRVM